MKRFALIIALTQVLGGCLLEAETCGFDFIERGEQCVPRAPAPPYRESADNVDVEPAPSAPDVGMVDEVSDYAEYTHIRLVDQTPRDQALTNEDSPGADIDAVIMLPPNGEVPIGVIGEILIVVQGDEAREVGEDAPQTMKAGPDGLFYSLGGEGGLVVAELVLLRPLAPGDTVRVVEVPDVRGFADSVEVSLCRDAEGIDCLILGATPPSQEGAFVLEPLSP